MIVDILQNITNMCLTKCAIRCIQMDTKLYDNIFIYSLDLSNEGSHSVEQKIIEQKKFRKLKILYSLPRVNLR